MPNALITAVALTALFLSALPAHAAETAPAPDRLATLRKGHPRVLLTPERLEELRTQIQSDPLHKSTFQSLLKRADKILNEPLVEYKLIGPRLLQQSRKCLDEVTTCALAYRLAKDKKYADRALANMLAASAFPDWHPSHFLDTAEMTCALGLGYDWLFDTLTDDQKKTIKTAIVKHGLQQGELSYQGKGTSWWTRVKHNWSQVCNGGLAVGALAVADEEPQLARSIIQNGLQNVRPAYNNWGIDGGWEEGPGYWGYTTQYTAYHLAALQSALGHMDGLEKAPGLSEAGMFRMHFIGPSGLTFNFADAGAKAGSAPQMFFFARLFNRPIYAWHHRQESLGAPLDLLWLDPRGKGPKESSLPTDAHFRGTEVVFLRSAWQDPRATWIGLKGGDNLVNHSHLELGTFVIDANGKRWVEELGPDDYNLPKYFGDQRWNYYRLKTAGQNTLLINGQNQPPKASAPIIAFNAGQTPHVLVDLTAAYPMTKRAWRGTQRHGKSILLLDEIEADKPVDIQWRMHTSARVEGAGTRSVMLEQGGEQFHIQLIAPAGAVFEAGPPEAPEGTFRHPLTGITVLKITRPQKTAEGIAVLFTPDQQRPLPAVPPLKGWKTP